MRTQATYIFVLVFFIFTSILTSENNPKKAKDQFVVVLDAGHGGKDPGRPTSNGYIEKDIALKITLAVGKELEKIPNIKVIYTRKTDVFVDLFVRGKIANEADADLFVSIHCNAHNSQASGTETFVLGVHRNKTNFEIAKAENEVIYLEDDYHTRYNGFDPNSPESVIGLTLMQEEYLDQSIMLAKEIEDNFSEKLNRKSRGVKYAGLIVLHQTYMPSVLVETGFITNTSEGAYLNSKRGQEDLSKSISGSIMNYKKHLDQYVGQNIGREREKLQAEGDPQMFSDIVFKVQIAASGKKLQPESYNFKGLDQISREESDNLYRYYYGETSDYEKIKEMQNKAQKIGYKSCFIVAYKNGVRIDLDDALKTTAN
ncbi:N-acetylmuramoyl-L-alanine amidase [Flavobacteriaceae bacterium MAR_2010_188]|nr:N-acetylmuramoyl-L-alanine amidase [Flavobacteriaceae bacterium MAR_2010_188]